MSEFLENKNVFNEISPSYVLIPENDDWMKANCLNFWKIRTLLMENLLVLPEFLKNKYFFKGKSPWNIEFLRNKCFVKGKSPKNDWIPILVYEDFLFKPKKVEFLPCQTKCNWVQQNAFSIRQNAI
jgi:hypothetical protein